MKTDRITIRTAALALVAALAVSAAAPLVAHAGPLLSGYGGPGQGNQAILGSTLLGGPGGGASGGGGAGGSQEAAPTGAAARAVRPSRFPPGPSKTRCCSRSNTEPPTSMCGPKHPARSFAWCGSGSAVSTSRFGLSGADISYVVLAAAALAFAGVLMRRMVRPRTAKGH